MNPHFPISFEFFPPNTPVGDEKLKTVVQQLGALQPEFFSVTYGAGGATRAKTLHTVQAIAQAGFEAAPHLSCVGSTRAGIAEILDSYRAQRIRRIVALRGDLPSGAVGASDFRYAAELVRFIRDTQGPDWIIEVAAYPEYHPQAKSPRDDLLAFKRKVDAGANSAITQYFYNLDAYLHFRDECAALDVNVPIVPGIMPIVSFSKLARFSDACGAEIPRWMRRKFEAFGDDSDSIKAFGLDVVSELCEKLIAAGAPGLHFYSMNQAAPTIAICERLGIGS